MTLVVRRARPGDGEPMAELSRRSFEPPLRECLVTTQHGTGRYWDVVTDHPSSFPGRSLLLAEEAGRIVAMADLRSVGSDAAHLSHTCVDRGSRGRGLARRLLAVHLQDNPAITRLELDVFADNPTARGLYQRLGFHVESARTWWSRKASVARTPRSALVLRDAHASTSFFETFEFCEVEGTLSSRPFRVGRVGSSVIRLFTVQDAQDTELLDHLGAAFPSTERFVLTGADPGVEAVEGFEVFMRSLHMVAPEARTTVTLP